MNAIKKTKSKRLLSMLLILTMVLTLMPMTATAAGSPAVTVGGKATFDGTYTVSGGVALTQGHYYTPKPDGTLKDEGTVKPTGGYIRLEEDKGEYILVLNNFDYTSPDQTDGGSFAIFISGGDCTIRMEGTSTVKAGTATASGCESMAIYSGSTLTFDGEGTLTAEGGKAQFSYGVVAQNDGIVTVSGGTLIAKGGEATVDSYGVRTSKGNVTVSGGTLTADGGEAQNSFGVSTSKGNVTVSGGTLTATGGEAQYSFGVGTSEGNVTVSGGTLTADGDEAQNSFGVSTSKGNVTVSGGTLTATGGEAQYSFGVGTSEGNVTVSGGTLTATGGKATGESSGVSTNKGIVTVSGGTLTATGGESQNSFGVRTSEGTVTVSDDGTLTAKGDKAKLGSFGVYAGGTVEVSNSGTLTATGGEAGIGSYGVAAQNDGIVKVSGDGTLTADGGEADKESYGVRTSKGNVTVSGGTLTAKGDKAQISFGVTVGAGIIEVKSGGVLVSLGEIIEGKQPTSGNYLYQKNDDSWTMNGSVPLPTGKTLTVSEGKALTVPEGAVLTVYEGAALTISEGAALDNKGTIDNEGTINALGLTRDQLGNVTGTGVVNCALSFADNTAYDVPAGKEGDTYVAETAFTAADGRTPHTFTIEPAVSGLSINGENKLVYTRPTAHDAATATVKVTDSAGKSTTITIDIGAVTHAGGTSVPANEATCTTDGNKAYYVCDCGDWFEDASCNVKITDKNSVVIPALGHTWSTDYLKENADADKHYHVCTVCNTKDSGADHVWNYTSATEEHDKHCTVCEYVAEVQLTHTHSGSLVEAKEPTFTADGNIAYYTCSCGKWFKDASCSVEIKDRSEVVLGHLLYEIAEGKDGVYTKGTGKTLTFKANGREADCTGVKIDGALIDAANYTKASGSTIITLNNAYLEKLSDGEHNIIVVYGTREEAKAKFTIKAAQVLSPKTGDNSNMILWIALMFISFGGIATTCVVKRKRVRSK